MHGNVEDQIMFESLLGAAQWVEVRNKRLAVSRILFRVALVQGGLDHHSEKKVNAGRASF
jgi:hypothetical protein